MVKVVNHGSDEQIVSSLLVRLLPQPHLSKTTHIVKQVADRRRALSHEDVVDAFGFRLQPRTSVG